MASMYVPFPLSSLRQLMTRTIQYELDVTRATGAIETQEDLASNLSRVVQLTGVFIAAYTNYIV